MTQKSTLTTKEIQILYSYGNVKNRNSTDRIQRIETLINSKIKRIASLNEQIEKLRKIQDKLKVLEKTNNLIL